MTSQNGSGRRPRGADLESLKSLSAHFQERRTRAERRHEQLAEQTGPSKSFYFGLSGLEFEENEQDLRMGDNLLATLRRVSETPGEIELAGALKDPSLFGVVARYARSFQFELAIHSVDEADPQPAMDLAWALVSCLRIKTTAQILVPVFSDRSWSTIAAVTDQSCYAQLLEDFPQARRVKDAVPILQDDLDWVVAKLTNFLDLCSNPRFELATDSLCTYHHTPNLRLMTVTLWSGIEALFDVHAELRYRLSNYVSAVLEPRGERRLSKYKRMLKLYDMRSKIVHGSSASEQDLLNHVCEVSDILAALLRVYIDAKAIFPTADIDRKVHL
ncbi:MAG: hypothetical protein GY789_10840 [Hyphomicrobiales bacterium]|nr:hypothetical protein [Hyphomicrobiales bacterium]